MCSRFGFVSLSACVVAVGGCLLLTLSAGCGGASDEPPRNIVYGTVTWNGQPIPVGEIRFVPTEGTDAPTAGGEIRDGGYRIESKGGVPLGSFQVMIQGYRAPTNPNQGEVLGAPSNDPMAAREQFVPPQFSGTQSKLEVTVEAGTPQQEDFALES